MLKWLKKWFENKPAPPSMHGIAPADLGKAADANCPGPKPEEPPGLSLEAAAKVAEEIRLALEKATGGEVRLAWLGKIHVVPLGKIDCKCEDCQMKKAAPWN
jgi:hypothetical protein